MTWQIFFTVFTFGGIGAVVRAIIMYILAASASVFPIAIVLVNILAAFLGAFIINMALPADLEMSMVAGFVGGLGTLSAIPGNILDLVFQHGIRRIVIYFVATIFLSLGGAYVGSALGGVAHIQAQKWSGQYDTIQGLKAYKETLEESKADLEHEMHVHEEFAKELRERALKQGANAEDIGVKLPSLDHYHDAATNAADAHTNEASAAKEAAPVKPTKNAGEASEASTTDAAGAASATGAANEDTTNAAKAPEASADKAAASNKEGQ